MFSELNGFRVLLISLILCVSSSAITFLLIAWTAKIVPVFQLPSEFLHYVFGMLVGAFFGLLKTACVSLTSYAIMKLLLRRKVVAVNTVIVIKTAVLTLVEAQLYYGKMTRTFPFGS